jgi:hypothetical protein
MAQAQDGVLAMKPSSFSGQKQRHLSKEVLSKGKINNYKDTVDEACRKVSFIKQKSDRYS